MRWGLIMLDPTEAEAGPVVEALGSAADGPPLGGIKEAFESARANYPSEGRAIMLQKRSTESMSLGGPLAGIAHERGLLPKH